MKDNKLTLSIESLGEFGLIDHLTNKIVLKNSSTIKGVGDDAAVLNFGEEAVVVTTDLAYRRGSFQSDVCSAETPGIQGGGGKPERCLCHERHSRNRLR
jgi:hypothetical protein